MARNTTLRDNASINDCERLAIDCDASDSATFDIVGPGGRIKARWLDAYMGILQLEGESGFCIAKDFNRPDLHCENFAVPEGSCERQDDRDAER